MTLTIYGELTDLNTYIGAERTNRFLAAQIKRDETDAVAWAAAGSKRITDYPVVLSFVWYTKNLRKDCDNVCFAKKFILDGLVEAGVLAGDGRRHVAGFGGERFEVDAENPRVEVTIEACPSAPPA